MEEGRMPAFPTLAAQLFADWHLFGEWLQPLWSLRADVLEEVRFYVRHVKPPGRDDVDERPDNDPAITDADVT